MSRRPGMLTAIVVMIVAFLCPSAAIGHDVPQRQVLNAFVKVDDGSLQLVVRVPLDLLASAQFPVKGREIDLASREADAAVRRALAAIANDMAVWEDDGQLVASSARGRLSLPSDRSFERYEDALAHVQAPVPADTVIYHGQGFLDAQLTYPVRSSASRFSIRTRLAPQLRDHVKLALRYIGADGNSSTLVVSTISGRVALNPAWWQAASGFVQLGVQHILGGIDHLLFLLCLVIPRLGMRQIVAVVTAFTIAHSFTLIGSAYGIAPAGAWFPPFVETAIALSIVYMALENIIRSDLSHRAWLVGFFGLVHGFGFSYALQEDLQFAGSHLLVALLSFNVGIELGQLAVLAVLLPVLAAVRRHVLRGRTGVIVMSALVANVGWDWMTERAEALWQVGWPQPDRQGVATLLLWVAGIVLAATAARYLASRARGLRRPQPFVRDQAAAEPKA